MSKVRDCAACFSALIVTALLLAVNPASAQPAIKVGVLTDMSSSYADYGGAGSVLAARMAIADSKVADSQCRC